MMRQILVFLTGLLFGFGLIVSGMINPAKVLGFLDIFGQWDASLAFVMGGAVAVTAIGYRFVLRQDKPLFAATYSVPSRTDIDAQLVLGPILFGIGWGLVGLCPGPAIAAFPVSPQPVILFLLSMLAGMMLVRFIRDRPKVTQTAS